MTSEISEFESSLSEVRKVLQRGWGYNDPGSGKIKAIGETVRFFRRFKNEESLTPKEVQYIETWITRSQDFLVGPFESGRTLNLTYYSGDRGQSRWGELNKVLASLLSLEAIKGGSSNIELQKTTWDYVDDGFEHLCNEIPSTLNKHKDNKSTGDVYFVLLNSIEVLDEIGRGKNLHIYKTNLETTLKGYENDFRNEISNSGNLGVYAYDLEDRGLISIDVDEPEYSGDVFHALGRLRRGDTIQPSSIEQSDRFPHLTGIARAWARAKCGKQTGIIPFYYPLDIEEVYRRVWGDPDKIANENVDDSDLEKVISMKDKDIQEYLYDILKDNNHLTLESRSTLEEEVKKSHSGAEISDFDIEINMNNKKISVSMPIKSAVEAGGKTAEKLSEQNINQIVRPATRFRTDHVAVFPILLSGTTSYANETIKSWRANFNFPINIINAEEFSRILLSHDKL